MWIFCQQTLPLLHAINWPVAVLATGLPFQDRRRAEQGL